MELKKPEFGKYISRIIERGDGIAVRKRAEVNPFYALFNAVAEGDEEELKTLLDAGADPNARGPGVVYSPYCRRGAWPDRGHGTPFEGRRRSECC